MCGAADWKLRLMDLQSRQHVYVYLKTFLTRPNQSGSKCPKIQRACTGGVDDEDMVLSKVFWLKINGDRITSVPG